MEMRLSRVKSGRSGKVKMIEGGCGMQRKLSSIGIREGKSIKVVSSYPFRGPMVIKAGSTEVAIGRGMANKIIVDAE
ncbi:ferrous iron transport protein A [Candidatus Woesearchaeota archaeon]|nr:ferrous iron transport protein A [Candidatus Woesearchaeota archaeon]